MGGREGGKKGWREGREPRADSALTCSVNAQVKQQAEERELISNSKSAVDSLQAGAPLPPLHPFPSLFTLPLYPLFLPLSLLTIRLSRSPLFTESPGASVIPEELLLLFL